MGAADGDTHRLLITGFGGQGIILAGNILGKAASIHDDREATLVQAYGPEARGGAASAEVVISSRPIPYPYVETPDILVCMSQEAFTRFSGRLVPGGALLFDEELVRLPAGYAHEPRHPIPATRFAEELGRRLVANIVMLGFITAVTRVVSERAMREAILSSVPRGTEELNRKAFERGFAHGAAAPAPAPAPGR